MELYKLNNKELKKEMKSFQKTSYGKIVFLLSYTIPIMTMIIFLALALFLSCTLCYCYYYYYKLFPIALMLLFVILISFILGSIYYYSEFRKYIEAKKENKEK